MPDEYGGIAVAQPAADQFGGVPTGTDATEADWLAHPERGFKAPSVPISGMPSGFTGSDGIAVAKGVYPSLGPILSAMGHGAKDGWDDEPLGLSPESVEWLSKKGIFGPEKGGYDNPFQAFNELAAQAVVGAVQVASKTFSAAQGVVAEGLDAAGAPLLGRDIAAMPEAFFGSPGTVGHVEMRPGLPKDVPTAESGALPPAVAEARDLGVIGPQKPDVSTLPPVQRAAAEVPKPETVTMEPGRPPEKAGNIRLDQIGINADAKDVILDAAKNNDDFNQARAGNVPLAQVESLSGASGVPSEVLTGNDGLGRLMHNDAVVRTWLQAFHQASDE